MILDMETPRAEQARQAAETRQRAADSSAVMITVVIASAVVAVALVAAVVALSLAGRDIGVIIGLVGPVAGAAAVVIAALGKLVAVDKKQDQQSQKLDQVAHQTNGALRAHIDSSVDAAFKRHAVNPTPAPPPRRKTR